MVTTETLGPVTTVTNAAGRNAPESRDCPGALRSCLISQPKHRLPNHLRMAGQRMAPTQQLQLPRRGPGQQPPQLPLLG